MHKIVLALTLMCLTQLCHAQFSGNFASGQFTLIDTNSNGSAVFIGTDSLIITGTNGLSGYGVNLARVGISTTGTISFSFDVTAIDGAGPGGQWDEFGYQLNGVYTPVAYDTGIGFGSVPVSAGDTFAFYVSSKDNTAGGLNVSVYDFSFSPATPLPLDLISFTGTNAGAINKLQWTTAHERAVSRYMVERSADAVTFSEIGSIAASNLTAATYVFADASAAGRSYYRLKMLDIDNSFRYSRIIRVEAATGGHFGATCSPLPFTDELNVSLSAGAGQELWIAVRDMSGKVQARQQLQLAVATATVKLGGLAQLPGGIYLLLIGDGHRVLAQQKIMKR